MNLRIPLAVLAVPLAASFLLTPPAEADSYSSEYRIVGVTEQTTDGSISYLSDFGIPAANQLCIDEFGSSARMANTRDASNTAALAANVTSTAWITPAYISISGSGTDYRATVPSVPLESSSQVSPAAAVARINCANFLNDNAMLLAPVVQPSGILNSQECNLVFSVSCAAPVNGEDEDEDD